MSHGSLINNYVEGNGAFAACAKWAESMMIGARLHTIVKALLDLPSCRCADEYRVSVTPLAQGRMMGTNPLMLQFQVRVAEAERWGEACLHAAHIHACILLGGGAATWMGRPQGCLSAPLCQPLAPPVRLTRPTICPLLSRRWAAASTSTAWCLAPSTASLCSPGARCGTAATLPPSPAAPAKHRHQCGRGL